MYAFVSARLTNSFTNRFTQGKTKNHLFSNLALMDIYRVNIYFLA